MSEHVDVSDVRMRGFGNRTPVAAVLALLAKRICPLGAEAIDLHGAAGRILASDVVADSPVPGFDRAAMDGYAIRSRDSGALRIIGECLPSRPFHGQLGAGEAVRIMTGAPLPDGADAVLPAEHAELTGTLVRAKEPISAGRHVGKRGEDIQQGTVVLKAGRVLRPQDVGVLASIGAAPVRVYRRPSAAVLVTGDELLPAGAKPQGFHIVDSNSVMLEALLHRDGAGPVRLKMIADRRETIRDAILECDEDIIFVSGGSSVGVEDHAPRIVAELGELCVHGVAMRPGTPTGLGFIKDRPVFLLPGNPVASLCAYDLLGGPAVRRLGGRPPDLPYASRRLPVAARVPSMVDRVEYVRVCIVDGKVQPITKTGASMLSSTTRADGFVLVPPGVPAHETGERVRVYLYDRATSVHPWAAPGS